MWSGTMRDKKNAKLSYPEEHYFLRFMDMTVQKFLCVNVHVLLGHDGKCLPADRRTKKIFGSFLNALRRPRENFVT